jgi:hypothetical protein
MSRPSRSVRPRASLRLLPAALLGAVLAAVPATAGGQTAQKQSVQITGELRSWLPTFDGMMQVDTETVTGTQNRFDRHLDLEERPEVWEFGLSLGDIRYGKIDWRYTLFSAPGNKVLTRDVVFDGDTFLVPETVHTDFRVDINRISLSYVQGVQGSYYLVAEVGMAVFKWKASVANRLKGLKASEDTNISIPLTGLHAIFSLGDMLSFSMGVTGAFFQTGGDNVDWVETYFALDIKILQFVIFGIGYKHLELEGDLDLDGAKTGTLEMKMSGIYLSIAVKI